MEIILRNINKAWDGQEVLFGLSLKLTSENPVALMGSSGVGKTTVSRILLGLEKPDFGTVVQPEGIRYSVVFQENRLLESATVHTNLIPVCRKKRAEEERVLRDLEIPETINMRVSELSGGQKRRVSIARAILAKGDAFLFDEPFTGLDRDLKLRICDLLRNETKGKPVLLITHDAEEAERMGCTVINMNDMQERGVL